MKIKEITFEKAVQVRPYEPIRMSATAHLEDNESPEQAMDALKTFVRFELGKEWKAAQAKANGTQQQH